MKTRGARAIAPRNSLLRMSWFGEFLKGEACGRTGLAHFEEELWETREKTWESGEKDAVAMDLMDRSASKS